MAAELWLLRHAEAVPHGAADDAERELTERGEAQSRAAGAALLQLGIGFSAVYASPKVRAYETARIACEAMGLEPPALHAPLAEGFAAADALALARSDSGERILIVGHNPDFAQIVYDVTGAQIPFKKGGVAAIDTRDRHLLVLLRPHELAALAGPHPI